MILKNIMEEVVISNVDGIIKSMGCCDCEKCKYDVLAIALNEIPPKYVVTEQGGLMSKMNYYEPQNLANILAEITRAVDFVKGNPWHEN